MTATMSTSAPTTAPTSAREEGRRAFLLAAGWGDAGRSHLAGDASARSYERLSRQGRPAVLMDAPPGCGDDVTDFQRIAGHLAGLGLSPPAVLAMDADAGFMLLEDLGDGLFTDLARDPAREPALYAEATKVLLALQAAPAPAGLPDLSVADWAASALLAPDYYARAATGTRPDAGGFLAALEQALHSHADGPRVLILRDYHAGNLLWLPERQGVARVGLLDFQLAQLGQPEYDLVSLLQDARRDVAPGTEAACLELFARSRGRTVAQVAPAYAVLGALRALRILGIFARLCLVAGKPGYLVHLPRVWQQLQRNLAHPTLARLRAACEAILPEPTPQTLARIGSLCGSEPSP